MKDDDSRIAIYTALLVLLAILLIATIAGCHAGAARGDAEPPDRFEENMMVRLHMRENFGLVHALELQLVRGHLDAGKELAASILETPNEPTLDAWAAQQAQVREHAAAIRRAATVDEALRAETELAAACARCHRATGAMPEPRKPPRLLADDGSVSARMTRHAWATSQLWAGVIGDDDPTWRAALQVLAEPPVPGERAADAAELQRRASDALRSQHLDPDDRAATYAGLLSACVACHAR